MFTGHYGPALLAKRLRPGLPLWGLILAAQAVDLGFDLLVLAGVEGADLHPGERPRLTVRTGDWTHSLLATAVWAGVIGLAVALGRARGAGEQPRGRRDGLLDAAAVAAVVASHWVMDLLVHTPDLPLLPGSTRMLGLGLWTRPVLATALEVGLVAGGAWLLRDRLPRRALALFAGGLAGLQILQDFVLPMPPGEDALAIAASASYLAIAWFASRLPGAVPQASKTPS